MPFFYVNSSMALDFIGKLYQDRKDRIHIPDKETTRDFMEKLYVFMFGTTDETLKRKKEALEEDFLDLKTILFELLTGISNNPKEVVFSFFDQLPFVYEGLQSDASSFLNQDPAAKNQEEIYAFYPGFKAIFSYRIAHLLWNLNVESLPRMITEISHSKTGIDIHPGAKIGTEFFIDHGTGVVIGETSEIGSGVCIYQGVTLGALQVNKSLSNKKRHPTIEDNVIIYSNATILGGSTIIGKNSVIGGNVFLTRSIDPFSTVFFSGKIEVRNQKENPDSLNFVI
jgi:serine O-acetyltransferase